MLARTFPNPEVSKPVFLAIMREHADAGRLAGRRDRDIEGEEFYGSVVGCAVEAISRLRGSAFSVCDMLDNVYVASALGIPARLVDLLGSVFHGLHYSDRQEWSVAFCTSIPVNFALDPVVDNILARVLREIAVPLVPADNSRLACILNAVCEALDAHSLPGLLEVHTAAKQLVKETFEAVAHCLAQATYYASAGSSDEDAGHSAGSALIYAALAAQYATRSPPENTPEIPHYDLPYPLPYSQAAAIIIEELARCIPTAR